MPSDSQPVTEEMVEAFLGNMQDAFLQAYFGASKALPSRRHVREALEAAQAVAPPKDSARLDWLEGTGIHYCNRDRIDRWGDQWISFDSEKAVEQDDPTGWHARIREAIDAAMGGSSPAAPATEEPTPSPVTNELVALVYRHGDTDDAVLVLSVEDHHADLEPFADAAVGGDWRECLVVHDDGPPMPPDGLGLWELRYPWREVDHVLDAEREDVSELCCVYVGSPKWRHIYDPSDLNFGKLSSPSGASQEPTQ